MICLTCADCNNSASRIDRLAKLAEKAKDDHVSGRGTRVEVDFFGRGMVSGYVRPKDDEMAARIAKQPVPTSIRELRGGVMELRSLPVSPQRSENKGIRFRIRQPNPHKVAVSWLRSAYLLLFSLLGREGYRYAKSAALQPIREQIMDPDSVLIGGCLNGTIAGLDFPVDPVIMLNHARVSPFWVVKMGDRAVGLPCGGPIERFNEITQEAINLSVSAEDAAFWSSSQFRNECVLGRHLNAETDLEDTEFIGGKLEIRTHQDDVWEWMIVDCQARNIIALPFRQKGDETTGARVLMMLGRDEYLGRTERDGFAAASPKELLSVTVDLKRDGDERNA